MAGSVGIAIYFEREKIKSTHKKANFSPFVKGKTKCQFEMLSPTCH